MIRRPPRSTRVRSSAASDVYKRQVQPDGEDTVTGVDVAASSQRLADEGVCLVVGAGVAGVDPDGPGEDGGGVERGNPDRVGDQLGLGVQDLLTGGHQAERQSGGDGPVVAWAVSRSASAARRPSVSVSWSVLVISTDIPGGGATASSMAASVAASCLLYRARAARTLCALSSWLGWGPSGSGRRRWWRR